MQQNVVLESFLVEQMNGPRRTLNWELNSLAGFLSSPFYFADCRDRERVRDPKPNKCAGRNFHLEHLDCGFPVKERGGFLGRRAQ